MGLAVVFTVVGFALFVFALSLPLVLLFATLAAAAVISVATGGGEYVVYQSRTELDEFGRPRTTNSVRTNDPNLRRRLSQPYEPQQLRGSWWDREEEERW